MAELTTPGVYFDKVNTGSSSIEGASTSVVAFMGKAPKGDVNTGFVMISSWTDFVQKATFGAGSDIIFRNDDYMAFDIYNFYQNGGGKAYFGVIKGTGAVTANVKWGTKKTENEAEVFDAFIQFTAKSAGVWANNIKIEFSRNTLDNSLYDVALYRETTVGGTTRKDILETYEGLVLVNDGTKKYIVNAMANSELVNVILSKEADLKTAMDAITTASVNQQTGVSTYQPVTFVLGGTNTTGENYKIESAVGTEGTFANAGAEESALIGAEGLIHKLDTINDVSLISDSGRTTDSYLKAIIDYCSTRGDMYAILNAPDTTDVNAVVTARNNLSGLGEIHYPFVKMSHPTTGLPVLVPASGMIAGLYARTDAASGVWKVAAGKQATLRGAIGTAKTLTQAEFQTLFKAGVNCIMAKPNAGIVMYGARSLGQKYVSDDRLDIYVQKSIDEGTDWAVFELNDPDLWGKLRTAIRSFLMGLYNRGAFKGKGEGSAYYVVCDKSLNTDANIEKGIVTTEYGYANKKPAEFVVHRLNKITASAE